MATLKNHPTRWLRDDAAEQFNRAEDNHGIFVVNSAGRTEAQQQRLIDRWHTGGAANRPPHLYKPAEPASESNHVKDGGVAIDVADYARFAPVCEDYGFRHTYPDGDPVHFDFVGISTPSNEDIERKKVTADRQRFLNSHGWHLVVDGVEGDLTKKAYSEYQHFLKERGWYKGEIDGIWGPQTQAAHELYFAELSKPPIVNPPKYHAGTVKDLATLSDTRGLQKLAKRWGYTGRVDNVFGKYSQQGFQNFLNKRYGGSLPRWLRERWGYEGDDLWGPNMIAAAKRANKENFEQLS